jgi:metal-responsive CopG/Arc/MetJ family transcriptional regulator
MGRFSVNIPQKMQESVDAFADYYSLSAAAIVRIAITEFIQRNHDKITENKEGTYHENNSNS